MFVTDDTELINRREIETMKHLAFFILIFFIMACYTGNFYAANQPGENLALGKKYQFEPHPNYKLCSDPDDNVQLTDGVNSSGNFWTQQTTVGWEKANPVKITINLENIAPISGVSYRTAAGRADVNWPISIAILVSDDGKTFYSIGDLVKLDSGYDMPDTQGYSVYRFSTNKLATRGRFIRLLIVPNGPYTFVDEIEVFRGEDDLLSKPLAGRKVENAKNFMKESVIAPGVRHRMENDLNAVRKAVQVLSKRRELEKQLNSIESDYTDPVIAQVDKFSTVFPLNDWHKRIFAVQAALWRAKGLKEITIWKKNRWDMISPSEQPQVSKSDIQVKMMKNEFRSAAFNISNAGENVTRLTLNIEGLPGGINPDFILVHDATFTDTKSGIPVIAALPLAQRSNNGYQIEIYPGLTRQIWFTFHPKYIDPGEYQGKVTIEPGGIRVPVSLRIYPFIFPNQPSLHFGGWDYTNENRKYDMTSQNRAAIIQHLREHFVDTPWATNRVLATGKYDQKGNMIEKPTTHDFEIWIQRWPDARNYFVYASVSEEFFGFKMGTPPFRRAVASWITFWVEQLRKWDIQSRQVALLLVDENKSHEQDNIIIEWAKVIQKTQPDIVIFQDPVWFEPWKALPQMYALTDILCLQTPILIEQGKPFVDFYIKQREAGKDLWFYSCSGPGKLLDPYSYHRMQQWFAWKHKAKGSCFWSFIDSNGASSWNEYLSLRGAYTPMFIDETSVTYGKHMEAIREGIEDFEYLRILNDRITYLEKNGKKDRAITSAKVLLASAADRVIAIMTAPDKINWVEPKDRSLADQVRIEILEALMGLREL
jgi:hypothetical protein